MVDPGSAGGVAPEEADFLGQFTGGGIGLEFALNTIPAHSALQAARHDQVFARAVKDVRSKGVAGLDIRCTHIFHAAIETQDIFSINSAGIFGLN